MAVRAPSSLQSIVDRKRSSGSCQIPIMLAKFVGFATKAMRVSDPSGLSSCFLYENRLQVVDLQPIFAERQGFEPWVPVRVQRFSRPSRSTAPASFHCGFARQSYGLSADFPNFFGFIRLESHKVAEGFGALSRDVSPVSCRNAVFGEEL